MPMGDVILHSPFIRFCSSQLQRFKLHPNRIYIKFRRKNMSLYHQGRMSKKTGRLCVLVGILLILGLVLLAGRLSRWYDISIRFYEKSEVQIASVAECARNAVLAALQKSSSEPRPYTDPARHILEMMRPKYLSNYKNPCWKDIHTGNLRCLPYFILAGVAKSGTSNLYWTLLNHPQLRLPIKKESNWWARGMYRDASNLNRYINSHFKTVARTIGKHKSTLPNGTIYHKLVTGDGSPSTSYLFNKWKQLPYNNNCSSEPGVATPLLMKHILPQTKLIFILRNPADRMRSGYVHWIDSNTTSPNRFHIMAVDKVESYRDCRKTDSDRYCTYNISSFNTFSLQKSMYSVFIQDWLKVFPRKQFHFIQFEQYVANRTSTLQKLYRFLELDPLEGDDLQLATRSVIKTRRNFNPDTKWSILPESRLYLTEFFRPYIEELCFITKEEKFKSWLDSS